MRISDWSSDVCSSDLVRVIEWNPAGVYSDGCQHENSWTRDMHSFQFESLPTRVRFGSGIIAGLPEEAAHMGLSRLLLLSTPQQVELEERATALLGAEAVAQFNQARSEAHPSELQSLMRLSSAVFCLKKKTPTIR